MLTEVIIHNKIERGINELETSTRINGAIIECLPLNLGDTSISRPILPDGSRGPISISTKEARNLDMSHVVYERYKIIDGKLVTDPDYNFGESKRIIPFRRIKLLAKIALGRVNHWEMESDYRDLLLEED